MNPFAATSTSDEPHFRLLGVPVRIQGSFLLVMALLGFSSREPWQILSWVAVAFVAILVHEMGHALTARAFGHATRIELHGMGGSAHHHGVPLTTTQSVLVSLAGPFAGFALGGLAWFLPHPDGVVAATVVHDILWITLGYGMLNLLPILPLDGGQALRALLVGRFPQRGAAAADIVSVVVGAAVLVAALVFQSFTLGFLTLWLLIARFQELRQSWNSLR